MLLLTAFALAANTAYAAKNPERGLACYIVLALVWPVTTIAGLQCSYELLGFVPVFFVLFCKEYDSIIIGKLPVLWLYFLFAAVCTACSVIFNDGQIQWFSLLGVIRLLLLLDISLSLLSRDSTTAVAGIVVAINAVVVTWQLLDPSAGTLTAQLYVKESAQALVQSNTTYAMSRLTGTFNNVVPNALFHIVAFNVFLSRMLNRGGDFKSLAMMGLTVYCGLMAASKAYFGGLIVSVIAWVVFLFFWKKANAHVFKLKTALAFMALIVLGLILINFASGSRISATFAYYANSFFSGDAFSTRYGSDGLVSTGLGEWSSFFLTGVGFTVVGSEFVGDSQIVTMLHAAGVLGVACFAFVMAQMLVSAIRKREVVSVSLAIALLAISTSGTTLFSIGGILAVCVIFDGQFNEKRLQSDDAARGESA